MPEFADSRPGFLPLGLRTLDLRVAIDGHAPAASAEVVAAWESARLASPRLFNGPILSYESHAGPSIRTRRDSYQRLAVQTLRPGLVEPRVDQLAVTGVLRADDARGRPHVLLGRRSGATRLYGGLWEFAPGGGVDAPPPSQTGFDGGDLFRQLLVEIREELDLPGPAIADLAPGPTLGLAPDPFAGSTDVVIRVDLNARVEDLLAAGTTAEGWEYETTRWIAIDELGQWQRAEPKAFIPPAIAIAEHLEASPEALET
ncbi:MAG: hypothetical protein AAF108_04820 [Planctomycetota bacterium]